MLTRVSTAAFRRAAVPAVRIAAMPYSSGEGATGSGFSRPGGEAAGDSFTRREKAVEDLYMRKTEAEKLKVLREKLAAQRKHLEELDKHIEEYTNEHGKEQK